MESRLPGATDSWVIGEADGLEVLTAATSTYARNHPEARPMAIGQHSHMRFARWVTSVVLVVLASGCSDDGRALHAEFSARFDQPATGPTSCPVTAVHFTDQSTGEPTEWEWTFGDGTTSHEQNPTWEPGAVTAEITLKVSRGNAEDSITKRINTHMC